MTDGLNKGFVAEERLAGVKFWAQHNSPHYRFIKKRPWDIYRYEGQYPGQNKYVFSLREDQTQVVYKTVDELNMGGFIPFCWNTEEVLKYIATFLPGGSNAFT